ncbi:MAG: DUF1667 domain-containing protein [Eubacterium sp.]|nr:DUF1667 domain-containing protein [Eubacterium sp.]
MCCTTCPSGCTLTVSIDDQGNIAKVQGNNCPRGEVFAQGEWTDPVRTLTSTAFAVLEGKEYLIPVKSRQPISKMKMKKAMEEINEIVIDHPVTMGDVLLEDLAGTGIELVACKTVTV